MPQLATRIVNVEQEGMGVPEKYISDDGSIATSILCGGEKWRGRQGMVDFAWVIEVRSLQEAHAANY